MFRVRIDTCIARWRSHRPLDFDLRIALLMNENICWKASPCLFEVTNEAITVNSDDESTGIILLP